MRRPRVIELGQPLPDAARLQGVDEMLVCISRDEFTDVLCINVRMGIFDFELRSPQQPTTRSQAVDLARDFIRELDFAGRIQWQLGNAGPITDEPRL